jgi:hypothetical protein
MDLSGWSLDGGIAFAFPEGTVIPAGGYLTVASDPSGIPGGAALGPFDGRLDNAGERLELRNNSGRLMDVVEYGDDEPWPAGADGSGVERLSSPEVVPRSQNARRASGTGECGCILKISPCAPNGLG